jgi:hypothetical protein
MATTVTTTRPAGLGQTHRRDAWWVGTALTGIVLLGFVLFATFRILYNAEFEYGRALLDDSNSARRQARLERLPEAVAASPEMAEHAYLLSPFYSPLLLFPSLPTWLSPAIFILWIPGGFRLTCYYYRKAYYRAFFADPPGCAVGEGRRRYSGETRMLLFQNLHRYFLYLAILVLVFLSIDVVHAMCWPDGSGGHRFGVSVGTLVLAVNVVLLAFYTFSCHSFRHLVGGRLDCFDCPFGAQRYQLWKRTSWMNERHMQFAWVSLFAVVLADIYVWLVAAGTITDWRLI